VLNLLVVETGVRFKGLISWEISGIAGLFGHHAHMMFQRRPFISQREKALALRDAGQSRHRRDPEAARPASAAGARCIRSNPETIRSWNGGSTT
jgi:hypothetical protein